MLADGVSFTHALVALLPVLCFLGLLLLLDSYKLIRPGVVLLILGTGVLAAVASTLVSAAALGPLSMDMATYSSHVAPLVEELLKGLIIVALALSHRIGFLVDAAIFGFAVGCGFALLENLAYLQLAREAELSTWIVRGFGTALMHGGATASMAVMGLSVLDRNPEAGPVVFLPGLAMAVALHWGFNFLTLWPVVATLATLLIVPALLLWVFHRSEQALARWLGQGFDADAQMLEVINSGAFADSHAGQYLLTLRQGFRPEMMADALCYLRLYTELALRAKGLLMLREHGLPVPATDAATRAKLEELRFLESSIGSTALRALQPLLHMRREDLWQINLLQAQ